VTKNENAVFEDRATQAQLAARPPIVVQESEEVVLPAASYHDPDLLAVARPDAGGVDFVSPVVAIQITEIRPAIVHRGPPNGRYAIVATPILIYRQKSNSQAIISIAISRDPKSL